MDKKIFLEILEKYNRGEASEHEVEMLEAYYELFEVKENVLTKMNSSEKAQLKLQISSMVIERMHAQPKLNKRLQLNVKWLAAAAILLVVFSFAIMFLSGEKAKVDIIDNNPTAIIIKPGSNQATLTLSDGSSIGLNDRDKGLIVEGKGLKVLKSNEGQVRYEAEDHSIPSINTIATPRGGQYQLILEDGTQVWLNAASSIKFPTRFFGNERLVEVTGEVYFEVARNTKQPFIVRTENQQIEVLGTHFNVNSYIDEPSERTTLLEGSVKVAKRKNGVLATKSVRILKPGQQATLTSNSIIAIGEADIQAAVAWKDGYFKFDRADIQMVMRQISRWYNVDVEYVEPISTDLFVGTIKRSEDIRDVLRVLERSKINASIKGRKVIITNY